MRTNCLKCLATLGNKEYYGATDYYENDWTSVLIYFKEEKSGETRVSSVWLCEKCSKKFKIKDLINLGSIYSPSHQRPVIT